MGTFLGEKQLAPFLRKLTFSAASKEEQRLGGGQSGGGMSVRSPVMAVAQEELKTFLK